jgi:hypothetical protein
MWNVPTKNRLAMIPNLYETEEIPLQDKLIHLHFFLGGCDWFIAEHDGGDLFWGFAILNGDLQMAEWGYMSFSEFKDINIGGLEIDCELQKYWKIRPAREVPLICKAQRWEYNPKKEVTNATSPIHNQEGELGIDEPGAEI